MPGIPSREVRLQQRPRGTPEQGDFELARMDVPEPGQAAVAKAYKKRSDG